MVADRLPFGGVVEVRVVAVHEFGLVADDVAHPRFGHQDGPVHRPAPA